MMIILIKVVVLSTYDDNFYKQVEEYSRKDGIFIHLAYAALMEDTPDEEDDIITICGNSESSEEERYVELASASKSVCIHDFEDECVADDASSYGIKIKIDGDTYANEFGMFGGACCNWPSSFSSFGNNDDDFVGINSIQNRIIVKLMYDALVFKNN
jgi:hypothetical protein